MCSLINVSDVCKLKTVIVLLCVLTQVVSDQTDFLY